MFKNVESATEIFGKFDLKWLFTLPFPARVSAHVCVGGGGSKEMTLVFTLRAPTVRPGAERTRGTCLAGASEPLQRSVLAQPGQEANGRPVL